MYARAHGVASVGCISAFKIMKLLPSEGGERCLDDMGFGEEGRGSKKVCFCDLKISMAVFIPAREVVLPSLLRLTEEMQHKARKISVEVL